MGSVRKEAIDEGGQEAPIYGDILESILSYVPLIDLVPASNVSRAWNRAVSASLRHHNGPKPWLMVQAQFPRPNSANKTYAYDPRSHVWIQIEQPPPVKYSSALRSAGSNLLYMLPPSEFAFSSDPLHLIWHRADAPRVWRVDPIVALVGTRLVVAGGGCEFEDDPLAIEVYNVETRAWGTCGSMPAVLKGSASSTWLSAATDGRRLFVTEKQSGVTHIFDPETKIWSAPYDLRPDPAALCSIITSSGDKLILIELIGDMGGVNGLKLWSFNPENSDREVIGEMPEELFEEIKRESFQLSSISACSVENWVYIYNPSQLGEIYLCELDVNGGGCRWRKEKNAAANDRTMVVTSSKVGIDDIEKALRSGNWKCGLCKGRKAMI